MVQATPNVALMRPAQATVPVDPAQSVVGLRPATTQRVDHELDVGSPEVLSAGGLPPGRRVTEVVVIAPLLTVAQVSNGVAIFGTAGGRAVTP